MPGAVQAALHVEHLAVHGLCFLNASRGADKGSPDGQAIPPRPRHAARARWASSTASRSVTSAWAKSAVRTSTTPSSPSALRQDPRVGDVLAKDADRLAQVLCRHGEIVLDLPQPAECVQAACEQLRVLRFAGSEVRSDAVRRRSLGCARRR